MTKNPQLNKIAFINGHPYQIEAGETILEFASRNQISIPTLCDDSRLDSFGACRVCSVDVALQADGPSKTMASCHTPISEGMHIQTQSSSIQKLRKNIVELVLTDHPLDCLTCESNGNCELQDVAAEVGIREVRYKNAADHSHYQKDTSHPYMRSDLSKCINCYRCVRACDEIQGEFVLGIQGRGFDSKIIKGADLSFDDLPVFPVVLVHRLVRLQQSATSFKVSQYKLKIRFEQSAPTVVLDAIWKFQLKTMKYFLSARQMRQKSTQDILV